MTAYERIIDAALSAGKIVDDKGNTAMVQCPAHADGRPSLSIRAIEGSALVYCMAGCDTKDVMEALGLKPSDLFDDEKGFTYVYPGGRKVHRTPDKQFFQEGNKADTSLFHADRISGIGPIFVVEGEKDVLAIESLGGQAVSAPNGASTKPERYDWEPLRGKIVHVVTDRDAPGRKRADAVAAHLESIALSVGVYEPTVGKDSADHIAGGGQLDTFKSLSSPEILTFSQALDEWKSWRDSEYIRPIRTPWHNLNAKISGGLQPGRLYVVGARTGSGKSVAGVNMVVHAALQGHPSLVVSVEMPHVEISSRILSAETSVPYERFTKRELSEEDNLKVDQFIAARRSIPVFICDTPTLTIEAVAQKCRMLKAAKGLELAFIDYAQLIKATNSSASRQEQVSHIARSAKLLAMELGIAVVLAAQLNRNADAENGTEVRLPRMTDLRESGELEQSADVILLLHRSPANDQVYVVVPKNRTGPPGQVNLRQNFAMARLDA